jgi:hypothetical protein
MASIERLTASESTREMIADALSADASCNSSLMADKTRTFCAPHAAAGCSRDKPSRSLSSTG